MKATQINLCRLFVSFAVRSGVFVPSIILPECALEFKKLYIFALDNGVTIACGGG